MGLNPIFSAKKKFKIKFKTLVYVENLWYICSVIKMGGIAQLAGSKKLLIFIVTHNARHVVEQRCKAIAGGL